MVVADPTAGREPLAVRLALTTLVVGALAPESSGISTLAGGLVVIAGVAVARRGSLGPAARPA